MFDKAEKAPEAYLRKKKTKVFHIIYTFITFNGNISFILKKYSGNLVPYSPFPFLQNT